MKTKTARKSVWDTDYKPYGTYKGASGSADEWRASFADAWDSIGAKKIIQEQPKTPWQILGVAMTASLKEITSAFRKLILIHHPDKGGDHETCKQIIAAYTVLKEKF